MQHRYLQTVIASLLSIACLALARAGLAVHPPPDGRYANQSAAEREDALVSLTEMRFWS